MSPRSCFGHTVVLGLAEKARLEPDMKQDRHYPLFARFSQDTFHGHAFRKGWHTHCRPGPWSLGHWIPKDLDNWGFMPCSECCRGSREFGQLSSAPQSYGNSSPLLLDLTPLLSLVGLPAFLNPLGAAAEAGSESPGFLCSPGRAELTADGEVPEQQLGRVCCLGPCVVSPLTAPAATCSHCHCSCATPATSQPFCLVSSTGNL